MNQATSTPADTFYPPPAFSFAVSIVAGTTSMQKTAIDAAFQEVSGMDPHIAVEQFSEGGVNDYVHQLPGATKHSNLVLKRGYVNQASALADWANETVGSALGTSIITRAINILLLRSDGQPVVVWSFQNVWPVKWEASGFNAMRNQILTEKLEMAYSSVSRRNVASPSQGKKARRKAKKTAA